MRFSLERAPGDCPAGKQWYVCKANNFTGCCSIDACDLPTCPDGASSSSSSSSTDTTLTTSTSSSSSYSSTVSSSSSTTSSSVSTSNIQAVTTNSLLSNAGLAASTSTLTVSKTDQATSSPTQTASSSTSKSNTPLIAGVVTGIVVLSIMTILIWFCLRRRKQKKIIRDSIAQYGVGTKEFVFDRPTTTEMSNEEGIFAPFGGRFESRTRNSSQSEPQPLPAILPTPPPPHVSRAITPQSRNRVQARSPPGNQAQVPAHAPAHVQAQSHAQEQAEAISACTNPTTSSPTPSDPEKAALAPPPAHLHPIYSTPHTSSPTQTQPTTSDPHPGIPLNPSLEPISYIQSSLRSLPSFMHNPTKAYERELKYKSLPRRTSEVTRSTTTSRRHRLWRNSEYKPADSGSGLGANFEAPVELEDTESPIIKGTDMLSPIPGRSELEGDAVPNAFLTPPIPMRSVRRKNRYLDRDRDLDDVSGSGGMSGGIGLGVNSSPTSEYSQGSGFPSQSQARTQTQSQNQHQNQQMLGPKGPDLTTPELPDTQAFKPNHLLTTYPLVAAANTSVLNGLEKEVVSPLSPEIERWSGATAIGTPGPGLGSGKIGETEWQKRRREELTPLSGVSVDVEREWGEWAFR